MATVWAVKSITSRETARRSSTPPHSPRCNRCWTASSVRSGVQQNPKEYPLPELYEKSVLANGVRVVTGPMGGVRSASLIFYYGVGSRYERSKIAGVSHFLEHMLFKGTERRP